MTDASKIAARVVRSMESQKDSAQRDIAKFTENLATNPAYAFEWSARAFQAAADLEVATIVLQVLENAKTDANPADAIAALQKEATQRVMRAARNPSRSTSGQSNEMELCKTSAWASLLETLNGGF